MEIAEATKILKAMAETSRLALIQALHEPQSVEELAERCGLAPSTVCFHLGKMEKSGLVKKKKEQYYVIYSLNDAVFDMTLRDLTAFRNADKYLQEERIRRYRDKVLRTFMKHGRVTRLPAQYKKRLIVLENFLQRFEAGRDYSEKEVDEKIAEICTDFVTVRRAFIDERMMTRENGIYRLAVPGEQVTTPPAGSTVESLTGAIVKTRQDIKREYKERKKPAGVFQVKNTANGKVLLGSSLNLEGPLNGHKFMLMTGHHRNEQLQKEWNEYGADKFLFEVLETVKVKDDPNFNIDDELTLLEQIWLEKLQPFGERGYNTDSRIRQA